MFENIYLEKIAKNVGLKGQLLPNRNSAMEHALVAELASEIPNYGEDTGSSARRFRPVSNQGAFHTNSTRNPAMAKALLQASADSMPAHQGAFHTDSTRNPAMAKALLQASADSMPAQAPSAVPPVAKPVAKPVARTVAAKTVSKGMSLAAKLGIGGLAAAGLAGGAYALHAANDSHHKKRASAIEGLVLAGYSVEQALQVLEG